MEMKKILQGMMNTMNSVKPPRMTALRELHEAETGGPFQHSYWNNTICTYKR